MLKRIIRLMSPTVRRARARQRLERIAIEAGASRSMAKRIAALHFAKKPKSGE